MLRVGALIPLIVIYKRAVSSQPTRQILLYARSTCPVIWICAPSSPTCEGDPRGRHHGQRRLREDHDGRCFDRSRLAATALLSHLQ